MGNLSTLSNSRDNNFNLIRAGAALGVFGGQSLLHPSQVMSLAVFNWPVFFDVISIRIFVKSIDP